MPTSRPAYGNHASVEPDRGRPSTRRHTLGEPTRRRQAVHEPPRPTTCRTLRLLSPAHRLFTYKSAVHPPISYAPPQNPRKHWPFEAQMERWFPSPDGERRSSMTAERGGRHGSLSPDPTSPHEHPVAPGSRGSTQEVPTRGRLAHAGADAGWQNCRRTGEICLAILPYGKVRLRQLPRGSWATGP
jgi:hypothetical protein